MFRLFGVLHAQYGPKFQVPVARDAEIKAESWLDFLGHIDDDVAIAATKAWIAEGNEWPPTAGQILRIVASEELPSAGEAWEAVWDLACRRGVDAGKALEEELGELVARAARSIGWWQICMEPNVREQGFMRQQFLRIYGDLHEGHVTRAGRAAIEGNVPTGLLPNLKGIDPPMEEP
jgi:hypothetical protein